MEKQVMSMYSGIRKNSGYKRCLMLFLLCLVSGLTTGIWAQGKISGLAVDSKTNEVLPGVSVIIKGTQEGITTDVNGKFELQTAKKFPLQLEFRLLGYQTEEITVKGTEELTVVLSEDKVLLDEVVVFGYGTAKKKDLVGSVSRIGMSEIKATPMNNSLQGMLQGKAAGVNVNISSASPSSPVSVIIRGNSSLSGDGQPLWVIDGVPQYGSSMTSDISNTLYNLNLEDVESIDILKDASATAIFGSRAANGVVIVTTKSGSAGMTPTIDFSVRTGIQKLDANSFNVLTRDEYIRFSRAAVMEEAMRYGGTESFVRRYIDQTKFSALTTSQWNKNNLENMFLSNAYFSGKDNYWNLMTQDAQTSQYDISLRGGNTQNSYYASFFYNTQDGVVKGSKGETFGARFNFEGKIRDVLKMGFNINASARTINEKDGMIGQIINMRPDYPAYNEDGTINTISFYVKNPLIELLDKNSSQNRAVNGTLFLEYDILPYLKFRTTGTINYTNSKYDYYERKYYSDGQNYASIDDGQDYVAVWENLLTFFKTFGKHDLQAILGQTAEKSWWDSLGASGQNFPDDDVLVNLSSAAQRTRIASSYGANSMVSAFARAQYKFDNRYLLTATYRADASSRFGASNRWGYFPSGGAGWIITEEDFSKEILSFASYLKLRASIGLTGSQNLGNYSWRTLMGSAQYNGLPGIVPSSLGNSILQWEQQKQTDLGLDYGFWNNRISGSLGYYVKDVDNLLYTKPVPTSSSFSSVTQNIGAIQNKGWEFDVKIKAINQKDLIWELDFNAAHNEGILKKINGVTKYIGGGANDKFKIEENGKLGTFYGYRDAGRLIENSEEMWSLKPVDPATGKQTNYRTAYYESAGDIYVVDLNGDGVITATGDREIIGDANPKFFGGFGSTLYWKGLRLNLTFSYSYGASRYWMRENDNGGTGGINVYNGVASILNNSWTLQGNGAKYPHVDYYGWGDNNVFTNRFIHDASYLRLSALNLAYRLPDKLFKNLLVQGVELSFQATNLFTLTSYPGMDPQGNFYTSTMALYGIGQDSSVYPSARNYNFAMKFTIK